MEETKKIFNKGDFIKNINKPKAFGIFEGIDLDPSMKYSKKYSLVVYFDPSKYCKDEDGPGWSSRPVLDITQNGVPCEKTIDTLKEDYSWRVCNDEEKQQAIEKLEEYNLYWDEEIMSLVDKESGEILHKMIIPKLEYHGEVIKPIQIEFKSLLKNYIKKENKPSYSTSYNNNFSRGTYPHSHYYEECCEYWD